MSQKLEICYESIRAYLFLQNILTSAHALRVSLMLAFFEEFHSKFQNNSICVFYNFKVLISVSMTYRASKCMIQHVYGVLFELRLHGSMNFVKYEKNTGFMCLYSGN